LNILDTKTIVSAITSAHINLILFKKNKTGIAAQRKNAAR